MKCLPPASRGHPKSKLQSHQFTVDCDTAKSCTATFTLPNHFEVKNCTGVVEQSIETAAKKASEEYYEWATKNEIKFNPEITAYLQPTIVEADWTFGGKFIQVPAISGWPQLNRLQFDALCCWSDAVTHACMLLGVQEAQIAVIINSATSNPKDIAVDRVCTVLSTLALTSFAGAYPILPEVVDDRTLGAMKFGTNRDCDDMAITVVAVFNHLQSRLESGHVPVFATNGKGILDKLLLLFMLNKYKTAAAVVCLADPTVATADETKKGHPHCGHVFAILSQVEVDASGDAEDLVRGATVIEATRVSSPYPESLSSKTFYLDGCRIFTRSAYVIGEKDIQHVKPFMPEQYLLNVAAYTATATYALMENNVVGLTGKAMAAGSQTVKAVRIPATAAAQYVHDDLAHRFDTSEIDKAIETFEWWRQLGFDSNPKPPCLSSNDWTHLVERNLAQTDRLEPFHVTTKYHQFVWAIIDPQTNAIML